MIPGVVLSAWVISVLCAAPTPANNGQVALVFPIENIVVDGDLSDWPEDVQKRAILLPEFGVEPRDAEDFELFSNSVTTKPRTHSTSPWKCATSPLWRTEDGFGNTQDGCEVFFFFDSQVSAAAADPSAITEPLVISRQYVLWGLNETQQSSFPAGSKEIELAFQRRDNTHRYEWKLDVGAMSNDRVQLKSEIDFGFDIAVNDVDADSSVSWMAWGPFPSKRDNPERMGQVVLLDRGTTLESLLGSFPTTRNTAEINARKIRASTSYQMFCSGILLVFTVVHFLLFAFYPRLRANLYFAFFTSSIAACIFFGFQWDGTIGSDLVFALLLTLALCLEGVLGLLFLYSLFYQRLPRRFWIFLAVLLGDAVFTLSLVRHGMNIEGISGGAYAMIWPLYIVVMLVVFGETICLVIASTRRKKEGAWIVGVGFIGFVIANTRLVYIFVIEQYGASVALPNPDGAGSFLLLGDVDMTVILGLAFPLIAMSVNLARTFGRIHRDLEVQLVQVRDLSIKTQEQNRELEEANRQIQEANRLKSNFWRACRTICARR